MKLTDTEIAQALEDAADLFEAEGWVRFNLHIPPAPHGWQRYSEPQPGEDDSGYCAVGALCKVLPHDEQVYDVLHSLMNSEFLPPAAGRLGEQSDWTQVVHWNNHRVKDKAEIVDAFRHVAKDLRNNCQP